MRRTAAGRRHGAVMRAGSSVCALASVVLWRASPPARAATRFSSFGLGAGARGWRWFDEDAANGNQEADVPESSANLSNGPLGYGLSSVAWPGPLASNAGTLILVLRPDAPPLVKNLNNPLRAEARTGQHPTTTTNTSTPGVVMVATATADLVDAAATVDSSSGPGSFGPSRTHARTATADTSGKGSADTVVRDINLAGGVVKIESVASTAEATTDGVKSGGDAHTTVSGLTIGGQPATIDENGLRIGAQNQPANAVANQIAQQALGKSGATITLSKPLKEIDGATTTVTAGSLVVSWNSEGGSVFTVTIGGATATVAAARSGERPVAAPADGAQPVPTLDTTVPPSVPPGASAQGGPPAFASSPPPIPRGPVTALEMTHRRVLRSGAVILAAFAVGLMALGMRRLSDSILAEPTLLCPLVEDGG